MRTDILQNILVVIASAVLGLAAHHQWWIFADPRTGYVIARWATLVLSLLFLTAGVLATFFSVFALEKNPATGALIVDRRSLYGKLFLMWNRVLREKGEANNCLLFWTTNFTIVITGIVLALIAGVAALAYMGVVEWGLGGLGLRIGVIVVAGAIISAIVVYGGEWAEDHDMDKLTLGDVVRSFKTERRPVVKTLKFFPAVLAVLVMAVIWLVIAALVLIVAAIVVAAAVLLVWPALKWIAVNWLLVLGGIAAIAALSGLIIGAVVLYDRLRGTDFAKSASQIYEQKICPRIEIR